MGVFEPIVAKLFAVRIKP